MLILCVLQKKVSAKNEIRAYQCHPRHPRTIMNNAVAKTVMMKNEKCITLGSHFSYYLLTIFFKSKIII